MAYKVLKVIVSLASARVWLSFFLGKRENMEWLSMEPKYIDRYLPLQTYIQTEVLFIRFSIFFRIRLFSLSSGFLYLQKAEKSWPIIFFLDQEIQRQLFF